MSALPFSREPDIEPPQAPKLRPYQAESVERIRGAYAAGRQRVLFQNGYKEDWVSFRLKELSGDTRRAHG